MIFFTLLNPAIGLLNYWLGRTHALSPLDDPKWALVAVALLACVALFAAAMGR